MLEVDRIVHRGAKGLSRERELGAMVDFAVFVPAGSTVPTLDADPVDTEVRPVLDRFRRLNLDQSSLGGYSLELKWRAEGCAPRSELVVALAGEDSPKPFYEERLPAVMAAESTTLLLPSGFPSDATLALRLEGPDGNEPMGRCIVDSLCLRPGWADALDQLLDDLGAHARPFEEETSSWAMIGLRRPGRWINLAEGFSTDQGISLAFTMGHNWAAYDQHRTEYVTFGGEETESKPAVALNTNALTSPLNDRKLKPGAASEGFSFLAAGHLYGAPQNEGSELVPDRLLAGIANFNQLGADFFMALGDVVRSATPRRLELLRSAFALELNMPLFNAVGNHDVGGLHGRDRYSKAFGDTFFHFVHKRAVFVVLDSELTGGEIKGEQLDNLRAVLDRARKDPGIRNIFVCSHKLLWCVNRPEFAAVSKHLNSPKGYATSRSFETEVLPILRRVATEKPVFWLSGDIGVSWSLPVFFAQEDDAPITYVAVGIGDTDRDAVLHCKVDSTGKVTFELISLSRNTPLPVADCGVEYWTRHFQK